LRDIHAVLWLYRGTHPEFFTQPGDGSLTADLLHRLVGHQGITQEQCESSLAAYEFLLRVRHAMHFRRDTMHDTLEYALQLEVAEDLGYGSKAELRSVEVFMHEYYMHARAIHRMHKQLTERFRVAPDSHPGGGEDGEKIGSIFSLHGEVLGLVPGSTLDGAITLMEAFAHAAERDVGIDGRLKAAIEHNCDLITLESLSDPALAAHFQRIVRSRRVAGTLAEMNELGVLERYIPEFGDLIAFFQHNVYHYYTVDEHTLVAMGNAERLRDQQGVLREVFRNLKRKDVLYMAILLHDIGKPRGVGDHEVTGVEMARTILSRLHWMDIFDDVAFLVRNHLVMEQIAFRRNIHDPATIREFASRFARPEQLDYLYLLTYADLSALNVNVWTEWKASMLGDLYIRTSEVLRRNLKGEQVDDYHRSRREALHAGVVDSLSATLPREAVVRHLEGIQSDAYTAIFSEEEIARHIATSTLAGPVSTMFTHAEGFTEVTIIAKDAPFALSKFCAVLAANDANIFDANVFTRGDGIIIDRFRVTDAATKGGLQHRVAVKISDDLALVMTGKLDIAHLFEAHRRRWKRKPKLPVNPNIRTGVEFEDHPQYTIIDVYAPDTVGFLYLVTETISRLGLDIYFAKIATRVDGIVDAFYVLDRSGSRISDENTRTRIRAEIMQTITSLQEQALASTG
jgi:[protein-PII] uridylyltransferase